ncbi:hypothetical protein BpHYR1_037615 [Brachionus plicatilis]|uniref:Uncharacterized protein n=1 Tax=Brachionus plicatilis TaxID=10195 RepID=A0A3M7S185_BRAPC|nr:hypothetical protein BpHYR1_037615 [Brachionus plicatilis]
MKNLEKKKNLTLTKRRKIERYGLEVAVINKGNKSSFTCNKCKQFTCGPYVVKKKKFYFIFLLKNRHMTKIGGDKSLRPLINLD